MAWQPFLLTLDVGMMHVRKRHTFANTRFICVIYSFQQQELLALYYVNRPNFIQTLCSPLPSTVTELEYIAYFGSRY